MTKEDDKKLKNELMTLKRSNTKLKKSNVDLTRINKELKLELFKYHDVKENFEKQLEIQIALHTKEMSKKYQQLVDKTLNGKE